VNPRRRTPLAVRALLAVVASALTFAFGADASAAEVIKIGTLAPKASPWGQVFEVWAEAVAKKSGGKVELQFFYNGAQGDEGAMVGKMKAGQLDGASVRSVGLSKIYKPVLALEMPGLFATWAKLDSARDALKGDFEKGIKDAGFTTVGWTDVGQNHLMSKGFAVKVPDDLKGKKPFMWRDDLAQPVLFQVMGGVTPVALNVPEVLPQLNTGAVNVVEAPALWAEQLQWSSKLDNVVDQTWSIAVGGIVLSSKRIDALPADLRGIVLETGKIAASALTKRIRSEDAAAYGRIKGKMTVVTLSADEQSKWTTLFKQVRLRLAQGTYTADLVTKLELLGK
jgi:TRAP-type C4-dicarboxylate transport system substrate-binding protein